MDAEMLGIAMGWGMNRIVATDSQGAIVRILALGFPNPNSWIEELVIKGQEGGGKELVRFKGHSGVAGNGYADYKARGHRTLDTNAPDGYDSGN